MFSKETDFPLEMTFTAFPPEALTQSISVPPPSIVPDSASIVVTSG